MEKIKKNKAYLALIPFLAVVICYEIAPLIKLVCDSFVKRGTGQITFDNYIKIFTTPLYKMSVLNSIRISLVSAVIGIFVAFFAAKSFYNAGDGFKKAFTLILNMTSNFAGVPLTFAFMILMGNTGVLTLLGKKMSIGFLADFNLYSGMGLTLIYIYFQIPLATLLLIPSFIGLKKEWRESAMLMDAGGLKYWFLIGIPNILPGILGTLSVLFANALAAYATAYALVLNNYALLALQISAKYKGDVRIDKQMGGALAVVLIVLMVLATMINNYISRKNMKGRNVI